MLPFVSIRLLWKSRLDPEYRKRMFERLGIFCYRGRQQGIWFHAVSLGEVIAVIPLINKISKKYPDLEVIVTTTTPSGSERVMKILGAKVFHVYIPYDIPFCLKLFLRKIKPKLLVCIETEIWPNLIKIANSQHIPVIICNARMSKRSARKFAKFAIVTRAFFRELRILAISKCDAKRFNFLGAKVNNITITGSIKYDLRLPDDFVERREKLEKYLGDREIFLVSSTHHNEEEIILDIFKAIKEKYPELILFLVPRHPTRAHRIYDLACEMKFNTILRTELGTLSGNTDVILGNTIGELLLFYSFAKVVFIGGSLIEHGGHNPLEAAIFGKAIVTGTHIFNFAKMYNILKRNQACIISEQNALSQHLEDILSNTTYRKNLEQNSKKVFEDNGGALDRQLEYIERFL